MNISPTSAIGRRATRARQDFIPLVRIKRWSQVTLPVELRKHFRLAEGDLLEVISTPEGILFKPVQVQPRIDPPFSLGLQAERKDSHR